MKRRTFILLLLGEAAAVWVLAALAGRFPGLISSVPAFPLEMVGAALGTLAKHGRMGNGLAAALWFGIALLPAAAAARGSGKDRLPERIALLALSCVLFPAMYGMVNPQAFCPAAAGASEDMLKAVKGVIGVSVWSVVVLYVVLRLIRLFRSGSREDLLRYLRALLHALCVLFTAIVAVSMAGGRRQGWSSVLRLAAAAVPYLLDVVVILRALDLIDAAGENGDALPRAAERLNRTCCAALGGSAAVTAVVNLIQFFLMPQLSQVAAAVDVPLISTVFAAVVLLLSRLLTENKQLRDDNSLFI